MMNNRMDLIVVNGKLNKTELRTEHGNTYAVYFIFAFVSNISLKSITIS